VAAYAAGERKLSKETLHPRDIFRFIRINLGVRTLQVGLGEHRRRPVTRAGEVDRVQAVLVDQPVEVDVGEGLAGVRAPVPPACAA